MKKIALLFLLLSACTTMEDKKINTILSMSNPKSQVALQGKTSEEIRQIMGNPAFIRKENPHESWVFKAPDCAFFVFFDENGMATFTEAKGSCDKNAAKQQMSAKKKELL